MAPISAAIYGIPGKNGERGERSPGSPLQSARREVVRPLSTQAFG